MAWRALYNFWYDLDSNSWSKPYDIIFPIEFISTSDKNYYKQEAKVEKLHKRAVKTGFIWYREVFEIKIIFKDFISHKRWIERRTCF